MSKKYHINPQTGNVGECKAAHKCKFGNIIHYDTAEKAQEAFQNIMGKDTYSSLRKPVRKEPEPSIALSKVFDTENLSKMISERYVNMTKHPDDPNLKILSYSSLAQIEGKWNDITKNARGLIIRSEKDDFSDAVVIERPWRKFFTLSQHTSGWALGDEEDGASASAKNEMDNLDFKAPAEVTDKMDGSLCILYDAPDGDVAISTKGSFSSDQAIMYSKILKDNPEMLESVRQMKKDNPDVTFLFEGIGKDNQIVVEYDKNELSFIGAVNKNTGKYYSTSDFDKYWGDKGFRKAETMPARNLEEALQLPDREGKEGMVVRIINNDPEKQMQIKIKQEDYLKLHRLMSGFSKKNITNLYSSMSFNRDNIKNIAKTGNVSDIKELKDTLDFFEKGGTSVHRKLYAERKEAFESSIIPVAKSYVKASEYVDNLPNSYFSGDTASINKKFALSIKDQPGPDKSFMFSLFKERLTGSSNNDAIHKTFVSNIIKNIKVKEPTEE